MGVVTATILSAGKIMDPSFEMVSLDVVKEVNRIPYAILTLLDGSATQRKFAISDDIFFEPGKEIEIKLRYEGEAQSEASVFKGLVVKQMVEANERGTLLTVEAKDAAIKMTQARHSAVYREKTDSEVFSQLIGAHGLKRGSLTDTQPKHPELVQYYCTDWDFMLSRADINGLLVVAKDGKISIQKLTQNMLSGQAKHKFDFGISEIYSFEIEADASHQRANVESVAWGLKNQKLTQSSQAKAFSLSQGNLKADSLANAVGGKVETLSSPVPLDPKSLQAWADAIMVKSRMALIRGYISVPGAGNIHRMDVIEVAGVGTRFNGKTLVTGVRQRLDMNGWQTDVQFGLSPKRFAAQRDIVDAPAAGLLPGVNGLQIGVVDQFEDDPDKEFRVKVILPGVDEKEGAVWARLSTPDAGKGRGYFFRPEKGDEVVVGFFNDDPRQAVILGALFGSKNSPPESVSKVTKDNIEKGIFTKQGSALGFNDKEKPSAFIKTKAKNQIVFDDDAEQIQIEDQHGNQVTLNKDGIVIKSKKDLKIEASGKVEIKGQSVDIK